MRDSFVFYRSFYEAIKDLPDNQFAKCARALMAYALDDTEPKAGGIEQVVYQMAKPQIDKNNKRYANGCKGGRPKETKSEPSENQEETKINQAITKYKPNGNVNVNENEVKEKERVERKRFVPPTVDEVKEYCKKGDYDIDAEKFVDFYQSKDWFVGKNKMKDWRAAVRNWARQGRQGRAAKPNSFNNFENSSYNIDDLEAKLLGGQNGN